jgi:hypothetical protein
MTPRPPAVAGIPEPTWRDIPRQVWWTQRGFWLSARRGSALVRAAAVVLTITWWPCYPLLLLVQGLRQARPRARYYLSPSRDAVLAIAATRHGWQIGEHASSRPGTGQGCRLRARLLPELVAAADDAGVPITANATTTGLAELYRAELPGLVDIGRAFPRGCRLHREPGARK